MKTLVLVLSFVMASSAFAGTNFETMSWASLLRSARYDVDYGNKIHFQKASFWVPAFSKTLCTDGSFIYGGTRVVEICADEDDVQEGCTTRKVDLVQPIVSERSVCAKYDDDEDGDCLAYKSVSYVQSPNRMINILDGLDDLTDEDVTRTVLGTKAFTIPACGGLPGVDAN